MFDIEKYTYLYFIYYSVCNSKTQTIVDKYIDV